MQTDRMQISPWFVFRHSNHLRCFGFGGEMVCTTGYCSLFPHVFHLFLSLFCLRSEVSVEPKIHDVVCSCTFDAVWTGTSLPAYWRTVLFADGLRKYHCLSTKCNRRLSHLHQVLRKKNARSCTSIRKC